MGSLPLTGSKLFFTNIHWSSPHTRTRTRTRTISLKQRVKVFASQSRNEEEKESPKLDSYDLMELKFGRLIGEDPKLTLAKVSFSSNSIFLICFVIVVSNNVSYNTNNFVCMFIV